MPSINPLYAFSGLVVGMLVGMTGVGGGSLMTPLLVLLFGIHPATAVGTDLLYASITKGVGTIAHGFKDTVNWRVAGLLATGSVPAAALTLILLAHLGPQSATTGKLISTALGWTLILTSMALLFRGAILAYARRRERPEMSVMRRRVLVVITGAILGVLVSISSVGAGALGVTALMVLFPQLATAKIVGSDIAHAVPLTFIAGMGHWMAGSVDAHMLVSLLVGSIPGILLGSFSATRVPETVLRRILAATLVLVGCRLALF